MVKATLFFSYSYLDKAIVDKISYFLASNGFKIWIDSNNLEAGDDFVKKTNDAIIEASKTGTILIFLSQNSVGSEWVHAEIQMILNLQTLFIPIIIDENVNISDFPQLMNRYFLDISKGNFERNMEKLLNRIKRLIS